MAVFVCTIQSWVVCVVLAQTESTNVAESDVVASKSNQ
jgi:hypothetical protein